MGDETVCYAYEKSEAIVVGTILKVADAKNRNKASVYVDGQVLTIDVHRVYKGESDRTLDIWQPSSSCNAEFNSSDIGKTLLLYLEHATDPQALSLRICSRSGDVASRSGDISWLDKLPGSLKRTYFSGVINEYKDEDGKRKWIGNIDNIEIELSKGDRSFRAKSNSNGAYELWDVPSGKYRFNAKVPSLFKIDDYWTNGFWDYEHPKFKNEIWFEIDGGGCAGVDYDLIKIR